MLPLSCRDNQIMNVLEIHEIEVKEENTDLKIKMTLNLYEVQFLTIEIVEMAFFFGYE
jgi:hypothetical protein